MVVQLNYFSRAQVVEDRWDGVILPCEKFEELCELLRQKHQVKSPHRTVSGDIGSCLVIVPAIDSPGHIQNPLTIFGESEQNIERFTRHYSSRLDPNYNLPAPVEKISIVGLHVIADSL